MIFLWMWIKKIKSKKFTPLIEEEVPIFKKKKFIPRLHVDEIENQQKQELEKKEEKGSTNLTNNNQLEQNNHTTTPTSTLVKDDVKKDEIINIQIPDLV